MKKYAAVLTIAGSDSSGGAGIQADIKTISALGCFAMSVITAVTAQNTCGVRAVMPVSPEVVTAQIEAVGTDIPPLAVKTGMLCEAEVIRAVSRGLRLLRKANPELPVVVDPVMVSTSGSPLLEADAVSAMVEGIFPIATLVTPNCAEAAALSGCRRAEEQIAAFRRMGCRNVLLKGGDSDRQDKKTDILMIEGDSEVTELTAEGVLTSNTHGTGCTLSAAIASYLALGHDLRSAVTLAKAYITEALRAGADVSVGHGHGPVNHFFSPKKLQIYESNN